MAQVLHMSVHGVRFEQPTPSGAVRGEGASAGEVTHVARGASQQPRGRCGVEKVMR